MLFPKGAFQGLAFLLPVAIQSLQYLAPIHELIPDIVPVFAAIIATLVFTYFCPKYKMDDGLLLYLHVVYTVLVFQGLGL